MKLVSRLPDIGTSIFTVMSKMALDHGAINLSQGFPDFAVSEELISLIHDNMKAGHNQYAPMPGTPALRKAIAQVVLKSFHRPINPDKEVIVTAGATEALFATFAAIVNTGNEVIVFDPSYDSYDPGIRLNGGIPVHINLASPGFHIPWEEVKSKINSRTKAIVINTPHNPTGTILPESDLKTLEGLALKHGLIVISDEVYERLIFENEVHQSVLKFPSLASQSVAVFSFGKTFHATGWKVGYTVAAEQITNEIRKTHQFITFSVNTPVQLALASFLQNADNYLHLGSFYQRKRDYFLAQIKGSSFEPLPSLGSYFQLLSYKNISNKKENEMAEWLTKEHKVAAIPVSVFYQDKTDQHLLRFCFAKREETLEKAGEILRRF